MADALTAGEGKEMIHQAAVQQFLWWYLPRRYDPKDRLELADAGAELLDELAMPHLAAIARSEQTAGILAAWTKGSKAGTAAARSAEGSSGVNPRHAGGGLGFVMGSDEARALDASNGHWVTPSRLVN